MKLHIQDRTGDTEVDMETQWDLAEQLFAEALANGHMAYVKTEEGNAQIFELSPNYETVVIQPQVGG